MGGITGFIDPGLAGGDPKPLLDPILSMNEALLARGPDRSASGGHWLSPEAGVALGALRSVETKRGQTVAQPITSNCGRYVLALDGAVYNAENLRDVLLREGLRFPAGRDAEALAEAVSAWGIDRTLDLINGPFAVALWDKKTHTLTLARDRMGIKPLYWGMVGGMLFWGSALRALRAKPGWTARLNRSALTAYLRYGWVPAPLSIYQDIFALQPAHRLTYRPGSRTAPALHPYWDFYGVCAVAQRRTDMEGTEAQLETLLSDSVRRRIGSSATPGVLLDGERGGAVGGALLASLARAESDRPIQCFSLLPEGQSHDGDTEAAAVGRALGAEHAVLVLQDRDLLDLIPRMPDLFDEPFGAPSALATRLVGEKLKGSVPTLLSAAGAEELFFGRDRYRLSPDAWTGRVTTPKTKTGALTRLLTFGGSSPEPTDASGALDVDAAYRAALSHWRRPARLTGVDEPSLVTGRAGGRLSDPAERAAYLDTLIRLPGVVLTEYDQAGLNIAQPFLDHRLVAFAWTLPKEAKIGDGAGMAPLRAFLERRTPGLPTLKPLPRVEPPVGAWLRGPLRDWAMDLLQPDKLTADGVLKPEPIMRAWIDHLKERADNANALWPVLMFQAWRDRWRPDL
ncbi:MAG: asparagine synthase-related protein [Alphaproteobacteria bacterium]|nr:asparagine synthase-related protein [Alphaproteobacteria bacterium]